MIARITGQLTTRPPRARLSTSVGAGARRGPRRRRCGPRRRSTRPRASAAWRWRRRRGRPRSTSRRDEVRHDVAVVDPHDGARRRSGATIDTPRLARSGVGGGGVDRAAEVELGVEAVPQVGGDLLGSAEGVQHARGASTAIRSASRPASPRKWVQSTTVRPCSVASEPMRSMTSRVAVGSRPEVGSSRNSTSGSCSSARARASRLRCPVEMPCTRTSARSAMPKRSSSSSVRRSTPARGRGRGSGR